jgi:aminoglycoside phosphotransferase (APT) family kinase protein
MREAWPEGTPPPAASGVRLAWPDLPARVRAAVEEWLGSPVVSAATQPGGFSPGVAARLRTAAGGRAFVKAVGPEPNPTTHTMHRREARIAAALPASAPAPRLLWTLDEGEEGWIALGFEDVAGEHPAQPWRAEELERVLAALAEMAVALTPAPVAATSASARFARQICGWRQLQAARPPGLDPWSLRHLDVLAELEAAAPAAVAGNTLLHFDIRADNVLLTPERVFFVDWPHACVGAAWVDLIGLAPSVAMQGGPAPEALLARSALGRGADPGALTAAVAALAGYFTARSLEPPPPGLPTVRAFQAAQGIVARRWLAERTGRG